MNNLIAISVGDINGIGIKILKMKLDNLNPYSVSLNGLK